MNTEEKQEADIRRVKIVDLAKLGEGIAKDDRGVLFVPMAIPGEELKVEVTRRRRFRMCKVMEVITPSPHRINPLCPYFGNCTGCQWQHIDYDFQLELKHDKVSNELGLAGVKQSLISPVIPSPNIFHYRNHARFTVKNGTPGFVNRANFNFIPVDSCYLMDEKINSALKHLKGNCADTSQLSVRCGSFTGDILIQPKLESPVVSSGQEFYHEVLCEHRFRISAASFFQVNTPGAEKIIDIVKKSVQDARLLLDAYAGVGTFSLIFSSLVEKVIAIEESPSACEDAMINLEGVANVCFLRKKAEKAILEIKEHPDVVILDPPRSGCQSEMIQALLSLLPQKIVYVSCNPVTLARDIKSFLQNYEVVEVHPVDLFPYTHHVECVVILEIR